jgi:hypothetical protein
VEWEIKELVPNQVLRPAQIAALRAIIQIAAPSLDKTTGLESLEAGRLPGQPTRPLSNSLPINRATDLRVVQSLLQYRAMLLADDGDLDAAMLNCRRMLALAGAFQAEPTLITGLFEMANRRQAVTTIERTLAQGEPSRDSLSAVRIDLRSSIDRPLLVDMLRGERAFLEETVRSVHEGLLTAEKAFDDWWNIPSVTGIARIDRLLYRLRRGSWSKRDSAANLRFQTMLVELAKTSHDALRVRVDEVVASRAELPPRVQKATEGFDKIIEAERRSRAVLTAADVALAAEQFRRDRGDWPTRLDDLVSTGLLSAVPIDPFDNQPQRYRRLPDGVVIYSIGPDVNDDGGKIRVDPTAGMFEKDLGLRLWDLAHRRRPSTGR